MELTPRRHGTTVPVMDPFVPSAPPVLRGEFFFRNGGQRLRPLPGVRVPRDETQPPLIGVNRRNRRMISSDRSTPFGRTAERKFPVIGSASAGVFAVLVRCFTSTRPCEIGQVSQGSVDRCQVGHGHHPTKSGDTPAGRGRKPLPAPNHHRTLRKQALQTEAPFCLIPRPGATQ